MALKRINKELQLLHEDEKDMPGFSAGPIGDNYVQVGRNNCWPFRNSL